VFSKILVANRGEIAVRLLRTLKTMGISSVAVYSEADRASLHVEAADEAVCLGPASAAQSYLDFDAVIGACRSTGATALLPGYGFLSENAAFARRCRDEGIVFIGPTPENMEDFGLKHRSRELAEAAGVPMLTGTELLSDLETALNAADRIGWPVMLKSTGGGGGIGMRVCRTGEELSEAWESVRALAGRNFKDTGVYLERYVEEARHVEVQIFGDGHGGVAVLGDRDCSVQRRNQKVIEECPAPNLPDSVRQALHEAARSLAASRNYANAGTVEFVYDALRQEFAFLEVNTRLQVEHTVTEEVFGVDLVEWMVRQAAGRWSAAEANALTPRGCAIQARLYAEDPWRNFLPTGGLVTQVVWPDVRVETWIRAGVSVTNHYDPLLAKLIVHADDRDTAAWLLGEALDAAKVGGVATNRNYLKAILAHPVFHSVATTRWLASFHSEEPAFEVVKPGTMTTVQDWPGRLGQWMVGIPPSGPMDELSFRVANRLVGNDERAAGLEMTRSGPTLKFRGDAWVALAGAAFPVSLDGAAVSTDRAFAVRAGQVLTVGTLTGPGQRCYLAVSGGIDVPEYGGSRSTFTLGGFGGHGGRALQAGDVLPFQSARPAPLNTWSTDLTALEPNVLRVLYGPQGAPDYFKEDDVHRFLDAEWEVHFNSSRTGVRLIGPTPDWPRADGGEAGLHPSNLHDNPYAVGALDFTGDMPVLLGPDGPSLGGFVCPFTVVRADLWKLGQLAPGARIRFEAVGLDQARRLSEALEATIETLKPHQMASITRTLPTPVLDAWERDRKTTWLKRSGDRNVLIEVGEPVLDLELRLVIHWWYTAVTEARLPGVIDVTPGIRSLQIHFDDERTTWETLIPWLRALGETMPDLDSVEVPSRTVWLPLSWDDPSTRLAIEKYTATVRPDAPWCPWNIEFIRRINGLERWEDVRDIVFEAEYLVLGLGDVYLGAPVATPLDPRHRLVTTKYNPARTWTPENAVGIGGAYLCVYGMEGPGGYQFVGRTVQMWNRWFQTVDFPKPWLLRFFDRIRFYPVGADELLTLREEFPLGRRGLRIEEGVFRWRDYHAFLERSTDKIARFRQKQTAAFDDERRRWKEAGLDQFRTDAEPAAAVVNVPHGAEVVEAPLAGSLWQLKVGVGESFAAGQVLAVLESMKMEIALEAPGSGTVEALYVQPGQQLTSGQVLLAYRENPTSVS
jgi:urea carboxylase